MRFISVFIFAVVLLLNAVLPWPAEAETVLSPNPPPWPYSAPASPP